MGVAALVFSILGVVLFWIPMVGWLGALFGLIGLVLGIVAMSRDQKGLGIVGIVCGAVSLIGAVILQLLYLFVFDLALNKARELSEELSYRLPDSTRPPLTCPLSGQDLFDCRSFPESDVLI
jgi:hypothetical protein